MMQHGAHFRNAAWMCPFAKALRLQGATFCHWRWCGRPWPRGSYTTIPFFESPPKGWFSFFVKKIICAYNVCFVLFCFVLFFFVCLFVCLFVSSSTISDIVPKKATIFANLRWREYSAGWANVIAQSESSNCEIFVGFVGSQSWHLLTMIIMGISKNQGSWKWMVKILEKPIFEWMIWGYSTTILGTPHIVVIMLDINGYQLTLLNEHAGSLL